MFTVKTKLIKYTFTVKTKLIKYTFTVKTKIIKYTKVPKHNRLPLSEVLALIQAENTDYWTDDALGTNSSQA